MDRDLARLDATIAEFDSELAERAEDDPLGVRFGEDCHWCVEQWFSIKNRPAFERRPTGIRFDLPQRWRQILMRTRSTLELGLRNGPSSRNLGVVELMGVQANWPLKMWWVTAERHDPELLASLPPYDELACLRCQGTGKRK